MVSYTHKRLAEIDFEKIWRYTAKEWGVAQTIKYTTELEKVFLVLAGNPLMCRERLVFKSRVRIYHGWL